VWHHHTVNLAQKHREPCDARVRVAVQLAFFNLDSCSISAHWLINYTR
jgi:hypothetical protein